MILFLEEKSSGGGLAMGGRYWDGSLLVVITIGNGERMRVGIGLMDRK